MKRAFFALLLGGGALLAFATDADAGGWCYRTRAHHHAHGHRRVASHVRVGARIGPVRVVVRAPIRRSYDVAPSTRTVYRYRTVSRPTYRYRSTSSRYRSGTRYRRTSYRYRYRYRSGCR